MTELRALVYVSRPVGELVQEDLDAILLDARLFNASVEVTGVLFHGQEGFLQYIEGSPDGIEQVMQRIRAAGSHEDLRVLSDRVIGRREFQTWHMGFCQPPQGALQQLSHASWEQAMPVTRDQWQQSEGLNIALYHWNVWLVAQKEREFVRNAP